MKFLALSVALLLTASVIWANLVSGATRLSGHEAEYHQQDDQSAQTDPEFVLKAMKQQQQSINNEQQANQKHIKGEDLAALVHAMKQPQQPLIRVQRSLNQASLFPFQQQQQQQPYEDEERLLRRQLPDLLAQAHTDKTMERALLRMLINASLRTSMNGNAQMAPSQLGNPSYYNNVLNGEGSDNWQEIKGADSFVRNGFNGLQSTVIPIQMSSRLGRLIDDYAGAEPISGGDLGQSLQLQDQLQSVVDKREYLKPCSFNAVSCAKNPFRKL